MDIQLCDILLNKGFNPVALAIRDLTSDGAPYSESYSHCGIYAGSGKVYDARWPDVGLFDLDYEVYDVYRIPLTEEQKQKILAYCASKIGTHYAVKGLLEEGVEQLFHIPLDIALDNEEWCSTFVVHALASAGILLTRKPLPVPNDIWWSIAGEQLKVSSEAV